MLYKQHSDLTLNCTDTIHLVYRTLYDSNVLRSADSYNTRQYFVQKTTIVEIPNPHDPNNGSQPAKRRPRLSEIATKASRNRTSNPQLWPSRRSPPLST
jgi:hypothetical protein